MSALKIGIITWLPTMEEGYEVFVFTKLSETVLLLILTTYSYIPNYLQSQIFIYMNILLLLRRH